MRPQILFPLFANTDVLAGVGPKVAQNLEKLGAKHVLDLLFMMPNSLVDRRSRPGIANAIDGQIASFEVEVEEHVPPPRRGLPYRVRAHDDTGFLTLAWFHGRPDYLVRQLPPGEKRIVSGKVERFSGEIQMLHPDYIVSPQHADEIPAIEPVYPMTQGLAAKTLRKAITGALERAPELEEWIDPGLLAAKGWPTWRSALMALHQPTDLHVLDEDSPARCRLAYDELLSRQLALAMVRAHRRAKPGMALTGDGQKIQAILEAAPFTPTGAQTRVFAKIEADMAVPERMMRLLQGDVGSGKTFVAALAAARAVEAGGQCALMAPTEILARQHAHSLAPLLEAADLKLGILTGRDKGKERARILEQLKSGEIDVICGTHALFQEGVEFHNLALVIIDEQHRFGVSDRLRLTQKGARPDLLVMTATPIPRTLALAVYGDMDLSKLDEKPPGRTPVTTRVMPLDRLEDVISRIGKLIQNGGRAYWVCPLVEESDKVDMAAAEDRYHDLKARFGDRIGLIHGRMPAPEKERLSQAFKNGDIQILVATTVVEVGMDVPEASVMVIEQAERFGLAQLHQLRGRVGRSSQTSACLLLYKPPLGEIARKRLETLRNTDDGFLIAETDWKLRGMGDLLGMRQSGLPRNRFARLESDTDLLEIANTQARMIAQSDPDLTSKRGTALRQLLYLFEQDQAVRLLSSG
ncbi:MAG: ATP-dependent DNA helicase RecG [Robiginitomaculum sp.]|nr:ATP-dependent DNA helicase RecG [Robiginitomaculum sp.]MDQ7077085.1 ATP-dependent DNA helicase RecG [Robiginitomaculum sp.]